MKYGVQEHFYTWQGEGVHLGAAAFFIRLYGCSLQCAWCDSAGTWHKEWPTSVKQMSASELVAAYMAATRLGTADGEFFDPGYQQLPFVVITGGEPTMFDLEPLATSFQAIGVAVHLETSGAFPIRDGGAIDWVTVSPKWNKLPLKRNLELADEIKIIVEDADSIAKWQQTLSELTHGECWKYYTKWWLHPEWSRARERDMSVLNAITEAVKNLDGMSMAPYRAGYQMHKLYAADLLDAHASKVLIPLGGNPDKGF